MKDKEKTLLCLYSFIPEKYSKNINRYITENEGVSFQSFLENPYQLITEYGIPFQCYRERSGLNDYSKRKISVTTFEMYLEEMYACIYDILQENEKNGNTWISRKKFYEIFFKYYPNEKEENIYAYISYFNSVKYTKIYQDDIRIAFQVSKDKEDYLYHKINQLKELDITTTFNYQYEDNEELCDEQNYAVKEAMEHDLFIITGGPGTGKTTTINTILTSYLENYPERSIKLLAPTGKAAKRMDECTGEIYGSSTIHFLTYAEKYHREEGNKIKYDFFIIDESSMIDLNIFYELLHYVDFDKLLLVGDINQLASVGCGNILSDLIENGVPLARLTINHRNGDVIAENSRKINEGNTNLTYNHHFTFVNVEDKDIMAEILHDYTNDTMILHPYRSGVININKKIQELRYGVNPRPYNIGDKVIFTKNNRKEGYVNGDIGKVIRAEIEYMDVLLDGNEGKVIHVKEDIYDDIMLAYALTIHKSQGSEYNRVMIIIPSGCSTYFSKNLLYTAVTRAKEDIIIIGNLTEFQKLINTPVKKRNTFIHLYSNAA